MKLSKVNTPVVSLSKLLAQAGIASRRHIIDLIKEGLVTVNGATITNPAHKVSCDDEILFRGSPVTVQSKIYILLNKPKNYITTVSDEQGRKTVLSLVQSSFDQRLYPVGRLDRDTTGLLLITNDGYLAQKLAHPRYHIQKAYIATLNKPLAAQDLIAIREGIELKDGFIKVDAANYASGMPKKHIKVILHSGKNRIVRRIFEHTGYEVIALDRVEYAGLTKKGLSVGQWRELTKQEIKNLLKT